MKIDSMATDKKVKDLMIPLEDYPHIPYGFTLRQAMAIAREAAIKCEGAFEPRSVLVFDEKYQLMGILTLRDMIKGLEPRFLQETSLVKTDPDLTVFLGDLLGPTMKEHSQRPVSELKGDLIEARLAKYSPEQMADCLTRLGKLTFYINQLDISLVSDTIIYR